MNGWGYTLQLMLKITSMLHSKYGRWLFIAFLLYHAAAVALFSIPRQSRNLPAAAGIRTAFFPLIEPYLLLTSQWQRWELFAPDPLRWVTSMTVYGAKDRRWETLRVLSPDALSPSRRARELKLLRQLEQKPELLETYLLSHCRLSDGIEAVWAELSVYLLQSPTRIASAGGWGTYKAEARSKRTGPFPCEATRTLGRGSSGAVAEPRTAVQVSNLFSTFFLHQAVRRPAGALGTA